ncbi:Hypothetical protein I5071_42530 [Sandaracinus amylolyticus]|nr:Hypothetical protein I5071_42530 [Sandaracinus amylolyticus]
MATRWTWVRRTLLALAIATGSACSAEPSECAAGTEDCPCDATGSCEGDLVCADQTCRAPREITLEVDDDDARACEVLLRDGSGEVASVRFPRAAGAHVREAPRTSISFAAHDDAPIERGAVHVQVLGEGDFTVERSRCFDGSGAEIPSASVRIGG